jgi:Uma2 family endonuclease
MPESAAAPVASPPSPGRVSYEEFLAQAGRYTWAEWVDGEVIELSPASNAHQDLAGFLTALMRACAEHGRLGVVRPAPFQMKAGPGLPGREPDVLFIASQHLDRLKDTHLDGPADLVVEIVSPDSRARDRGEKFYEYEEGGVREYWLIDPRRRRAEVFVRGEDAVFRLAPPEADGRLRSAVLSGFWLETEWLWQDPLPQLLTVLKAWGVIS